MTYGDVLEPLAVIPQAKHAKYGSAYNLTLGHFGIPAQVRIMMQDRRRACRQSQRLRGRAGTVGYLPVLE